MTIINLRNIFPEYELDCFVEVADLDADAFVKSLTKEVVEVYITAQRAENAGLRQMYRYKAYYSLDNGDGIENDITTHEKDLFAILADKQDKANLYAALNSLPEKQLSRIYAHYFVGMSKAEIARSEDVDEKNIRQSLERGLGTLKNILRNSF